MTLYNVSQAGKELRLSAITVRRMIRAGEIPHHRLGGKIFLTEQDMQDCIDRSAVPAKKPAKGAARD
jgi:excisionase family DNA binding protein